MNWHALAKLRYSQCSRLLVLLVAGLSVLPGLRQVAAQEKPAGARVVIVEQPGTCRAPVRKPAYFQPQPEAVHQLLEEGLRRWTGATNSRAAWRQLVSTNDVIGIKIAAEAGPIIGTRPAVVRAVVNGLLAAGIPARQIILWDRHDDPLHAGGYFQLAKELGVGIESAARAGYEPQLFHDEAVFGLLDRGDLDFGKQEGSRHSHVTKLVTRRLDKIIQISSLLQHPVAGVEGNLYGLAMGGADNTRRFQGLRPFLHNVVPNLYRLTAHRGVIMDRGFDTALAKATKDSGGSLRGLVPPGVNAQHLFFYEPHDAEKPLPPLQALQLALAGAARPPPGPAKVIITDKAETQTWEQTIHPSGLVEYSASASRVCLHIVDALLCQYVGGEELRLQYSTVLNQLRLGTDPVALDVLSLQDIERQTMAAQLRPVAESLQLLRHAALLGEGVADEKLIRVERHRLPPFAPAKTP